MTIEFGEVNRYDQASTFPAVDLIFTGPKKSLVDRVSGKSLQFTRNTIGTYVDANGIIQTAAAGEPRYTYDPETGEELGLLIEESRANVLFNSGNLADLSSWTLTEPANQTLTANAIVSPDGTTSATQFTTNNPTGFGYQWIVQTRSGSYGNVTVTGSFWAKADTPRTLTAHITDGVAGSSYNYDVTTEWKRFSFTKTCAASASQAGLAPVFITNQPAGITVYLWGAQLEAGAFPTSYIPTTSSTVTRDPDTVTLTNNNLYDNSQYDIISDPFGMVSGSDTLTLLPSNSANSTLKRATIFSTNITRNKINTFVKKTDEFWRWRVFGTSFRLSNFETTGQVTVDWGDGTVETLTTSEHTFTNGGGFHEIGFRLDSGTYFRPQLYLDADNREKLIATGPTPESMVVSLEYSFRECINLTAMDSNIYNSGYSRSIVLACAKLRSFPRIENVNRLDYAWTSATGLTKFPLLDTSNVNYFSGAWSGCTGLTEFPAIDTSNAISLYQSWFGCSNLQSFPLIDTSSGPDIRGAWRLCSSLTSFPTIDTSSCTSFDQAWMNCSGLTTFPLLDSSSSTDFRNAWQGCSGLTTFPSLNLSSGTRFAYAWAFCSSLTDFPANLFDNCTTQFDNFAFNNTWGACTSLTSTSVENILNSISVSAASGTSPASGTGINISYNASSGTPDITVPAVDLIAKGWVPTLNGSAKNNAYSSDFATLDLDFATNLSLTDNISGNNLVTFSRDSIGTYVDSNGVIQTATANTPRFDHDPETGESLGLLIEESRTNLITYSEELDNAAWGKFNGSILANTDISPSGNQTADKWRPDTVNGFHYAQFAGISGSATPFTYSIFAKQSGYRYLLVNTPNGSVSGNSGPIIDLQDGVVAGNFGATYPTTVTGIGNGWWRIAMTFTGNGLLIAVDHNPFPTTSVTPYAGDGTSGVLLWGAQLEQGSFPTSYIPNNGTPGGIIRAADVASISGTDLTSWFNQSEGTFRVRGQNDVPVSAGNAGGMRFMSLSTGPLVYQDTTYNFSSNSANYGAVFGIRAENGSNNNFYGNIGWTNTFPTQNYVGSYNSTSSTIGYNNVSRTESFNFTLQSDLSHMWIGRMHNFGPNRNHIGRISYWPKKLTDKSIQFLSQ